MKENTEIMAIHASLFAQINTDPFLRGSVRLEGLLFKINIDYLHLYIDELEESQQSDEIKQLRTLCNNLTAIEQQMQQLREKNTVNDVDAQVLATEIFDQINKLKHGESLLMPGGWIDAQDGHAMIYEWHRDDAGDLLFKVYNSGAGLEFHEKRSSTDKELYNPVLTYKIPQASSGKKEYLTHIIKKLIELQVPKLHGYQDIKPDILYKGIFDQFSHVDGEKCLNTDVSQDHWFTAGQISGTCTQRSLHQMLKSRFANLDEYRKFIYGLKAKSIDDYYSHLVKRGEDRNPQYLAQFEKAIRHSLRLLMLHESNSPTTFLFSPEKRMADRKKLEGYLSIVRNNRLDPQQSEQKENQSLVEISINPVYKAQIPDTVTPNAQPLEDVKRSNTSKPIQVTGGANLLTELDNVIERCMTLKNERQFHLILEQLDTLIHHLPLPNTLTDNLLEFYSGIDSEQKSYEFYKKINEIQKLYFECHDQLIDQTHATPNMYLAKMTLYTVVGHINHQYQLTKRGKSFHQELARGFIHQLIFGCNDTPYLATQNPTLDNRLNQIRTLYKRADSVKEPGILEYLKYYDSILNTQPELKRDLESMYTARYNSDTSAFHKHLRENQETALFYFLQHNKDDDFNKERFKPLIDKFELQKTLEQTYLYGGRLSSSSSNSIGEFSISYNSQGLTIPYNTIKNLAINDNAVRTKYISQENSTQCALTIDNRITKMRDNNCQLFPTKYAAEVPDGDPTSELTNDDIEKIISMPITKETMAERELFHLRANANFQIDLTLAYFDEHMHKLKNTDYQHYLEANLFQPGLLLKKLQSSSNMEFMSKFNAFIQRGLDFYQKKGEHTQTSIALFYLKYQVYQYAYVLNPEQYTEDLTSFLNEIDRAIAITRQTVIQHQLYWIKFQTLMAKSTVNALSSEEIKALVVSRFISSVINPTLLDLDVDTTFKIERQQQDFIRLIQQHQDKIDPSILMSILENLKIDLPINSLKIEGTYPLYRISHKDSKDVYTLNIEQGLVYKDELAYTALPLNIINHPAISDIGIKNARLGFVSADKTTYYIEQPPVSVRFILKGNRYHIQRQFIDKDGNKAYFELIAQSKAHQEKYQLSTACSDENFSDLIKQRDVLFWKHTNKDEFIIASKGNNEQQFYGTKKSALDNSENAWLIEDCKNQRSLLHSNSVKHRIITQFESQQFIHFYDRPDAIDIDLSRYNLSLTLSKTTKAVSYHWQGHEYTLTDAPAIIPGIPSLQLTHENDNICIFPIQTLISTGTQQKTSEYYQLTLDTQNKIANQEMKEKPLMLWQHTGSQKHLVLKIKDNTPVPETPAQALYLAYLYLGTNDYDNALKMIESCNKKLGGLTGTYEELQYLQWIFQKMPYRFPGDKEAEVLNPNMVVCKLKALALLTTLNAQGKDIAMPPLTKPATTTNERYENLQIQEVQQFKDNVNRQLYQFYSTYQKLYRESLVDFQLSDNERYHLLHYYHQHIPSKDGNGAKAIGALGYDWVSLKFKALKKELALLKSKTTLNRYEQDRLKEIDSFIKHHQGVAKIRSDIKYVKIDTSLPITCALNTSQLSEDSRSNVQDENLPLKNIARRTTTAAQQSAMIKLLPDIDENTFIQYFTNYLAIASDPHNHYREELRHFCHATLIIERHTPLLRKSGNIALLCNILYRVLNSKQPLPREITTYTQLIEYATRLPDPIVEVAELVNKTDQLLKTPKEVFDALPEHHINLPVPPIKTLNNDLNEIQLFSPEDMKTFEKDVAQWRKIESTYMECKEVNDTLEGDDHFLSPEEHKAGIEKFNAFHELKNLASHLLNDEKINRLEANVKDRITAITKQSRDIEQAMIELANRDLENEEDTLQWQLEIAAGTKTRLDINKLIQLYFNNDLEQYKSATGLKESQIQTLHSMMTQYVKLQQTLQQLKRTNHHIKQVESSTDEERAQRKIKLAQTLYAQNLIDPIKEPALSVYQLFEDILIRPIQKSAIERLLCQRDEEEFVEGIERIIMGGGKSKVLLPTLAYKKAQGNNLAIIAVPNALLRTNYVDLKNSSSKLFGQDAFLFEFNRSSDCSSQRLEELFENLTHAMVNKSYMVTTGDALQSIALKYLELLYTPPDVTAVADKKQSQQIITEWQKQIYWADKIVNLFKQRGDLIIDEVHLGLVLKNKLNYTIGAPTTIDKKLIENNIQLFKFLNKCTVLDDKNNQIPLSNLIFNPKMISDPRKYEAAFHELLVQLIRHPDSPLQPIIKDLSSENIEKLQDYLHDQGNEVPDFIQQLTPDQKNKLALYKEQINHLLPYTLKRNHLEHFGPSHNSTLSPETAVLAIPYVANNTPNERSRFGNPLLSMNFTIQSLLNNAVSKPLLRSYLDMLMTQAKYEIENDGYTSINDTPSAHQFSAIMGNDNITLNDVDMDNDEQLSAIHQLISKNELLIYTILETQVLPNIKIDPKVLHSDAYNYVDLVRSCQGMSGTPSNHSTFHKRLKYDEKNTLGIDGLVYETMQYKTDHIWGYDYTNVQDAISQLFGHYDDAAELRAIIDINATFKGQSNLSVASAVAHHLCENPEKFQKTNKIKYILFFNEHNQICALPLDNFPHNSPIVIGSSDVATINARLGCGPEERFTIYDQAHTTGTDIKQAENARALVMVDDHTSLSNCFQGVMRMRGLIEESQRIDIVVPTKMANESIASICKTMHLFEQSSLQEDNYAAACAQLKNSVRDHVIRMILAVEGEDKLDRKHALLVAFESLFFETQEQNLFEKYGRLMRMENTHSLLLNLKDELLSNFKKITSDLQIQIETGALSSLEAIMDNIIEEASKPDVCKESQPTNQSDLGEAVEVQKEKEKEIEIEVSKEVEKELMNQQFDPLLTPMTQTPWHIHLKKLGPRCPVKSLSEICNTADNKAPYFSPKIKATENFFKTYKNQEQYLDMYLKPVHCLLFIINEHNELECFILSQQEGVELARDPTILTHHKAWITTTQSICLAGTAPEGIQTNPEYQSIIEQVKFFNGEFHSLLTSGAPLNWLSESSKEKLEFFEQYLYPNHETLPTFVSRMYERLLNKQRIYQHIISKLTIDGETYDWRLHYPNMDDEFITEIKQFCLACNDLHDHWPQLDLSKPDWHAHYNIPLASLGYLQPVINKHKALKALIDTLEQYSNENDGMEKIQIAYAHAAQFFPMLKHDKNTYFDIIHSLLDLMTIEQYTPSPIVTKLFANDPGITPKQLQEITEIAKTDSNTLLKLLENPSQLVDEALLKQLMTYSQTEDTILALAKHPHLPSTCFHELFEKAKTLSCANKVKSHLLQKADCPRDLCLVFLNDNNLIFTEPDIRKAAAYLDNYDLLIDKLKNLPAETRLNHQWPEFTDPVKLMNTSEVNQKNLAIHLNTDVHRALLALEHPSPELIKTLCIYNTDSALQQELLNAINPSEHETLILILENTYVTPQTILEISSKPINQSVVSELLKHATKDPDPIYMALLNNTALLGSDDITEAQLEKMAENTQDIEILRLILNREPNKKSDQLLNTILDKDRNDALLDEYSKLDLSGQMSIQRRLIKKPRASTELLLGCLNHERDDQIEILKHRNCSEIILNAIAAEQSTDQDVLDYLVQNNELNDELCTLLMSHSPSSIKSLNKIATYTQSSDVLSMLMRRISTGEIRNADSILASICMNSKATPEIIIEIAKKPIPATMVTAILETPKENQDLIYKALLENQHVLISDSQLKNIIENTNNLEIFRLILNRQSLNNPYDVLGEIISKDRDNKLLDEYLRIALPQTIQTKLIIKKEASAALLMHCLNDDPSDQIKILEHQNCSAEIVNAIAERATDPKVLNTLIQKKKLSDQLYDKFIDDPRIHAESLASIAAQAQSEGILVKLLKRISNPSISKPEPILISILKNPNVTSQIILDIANQPITAPVISEILNKNIINPELIYKVLLNNDSLLTNDELKHTHLEKMATTTKDISILKLILGYKSTMQLEGLLKIILSNENIDISILQDIAMKAQLNNILITLLQDNRIDDSIRLKIVNNDNMTDQYALLALFETSHNEEIIHAILGKKSINGSDNYIQSIFLSIVKQAIESDSNNESFKLRAIKEFINAIKDYIQFALDKSMTSQRHIVFKTMSQKEKEQALEQELVDLNIAIAKENPPLIQAAFEKLSTIACTRRNALTSLLASKYSTSTHSAKYLIEQFKNKPGLLKALNISSTENPEVAIKKAMLSACQKAAAEKHHHETPDNQDRNSNPR